MQIENCTEWRRYKTDVAAGVMIHVGGIYKKDNHLRYAASEGCFGITNSDKNSSNDYSNSVLNSIINQSQKSKTNKGKIGVIIEKRNKSERQQTKNIVIKWK